MSTDYVSIPGQTDLAFDDSEGEFPLNLDIAGNQTPNNAVDAPLPRPKRQPRRARADRGLPPDDELANLARAYLHRQHKHRPEMVQAGLLPQSTDDVIQRMVEDFKERHRTAKVKVDAVIVFAKFCLKLGGNYNRFSCDNSSPLSIIDQMVNALDKARSENRFVPWAYVFCDYSVTGLDADRQGYSSYKTVLADEHHLIETTYVDDFTRPSRSEVEWWALAAQTRRLNKRLIGASDVAAVHQRARSESWTRHEGSCPTGNLPGQVGIGLYRIGRNNL